MRNTTDRRALRTREALLSALAYEVKKYGYDGVTVSSLTDRANITRRTFYLHYSDLDDFKEKIEQSLLDELSDALSQVRDSTLEEVFEAIRQGEAYPGAETVFKFAQDNVEIMSAVLGEHGDCAFQFKLKEHIRQNFMDRVLTGIDVRMLGPAFTYYVEYIISATLGVMQHWISQGMQETPQEMARIVTIILFLRPGDLYGMPLEAHTNGREGMLEELFSINCEIQKKDKRGTLDD